MAITMVFFFYLYIWVLVIWTFYDCDEYIQLVYRVIILLNKLMCLLVISMVLSGPVSSYL